MLSILTVPEALAELSKATGHEWTANQLFDIAAGNGVQLHAVVPPTVGTSIQRFEIGKGLVEKHRMPAGHSLLAVLFPFQVARLWMSGEAEAMHPADHDRVEGEFKFLTEPISVTIATVRIKAQSLAAIREIVDPKQTMQSEVPATPVAPEVHAGVSGIGWSLRAQERVRDPLATMIYDVLKAAHSAKEPRPKAREVMNAIADKKPLDFLELLNDEIKVVGANGDPDSVSIESIRARIERMSAR